MVYQSTNPGFPGMKYKRARGPLGGGGRVAGRKTWWEVSTDMFAVVVGEGDGLACCSCWEARDRGRVLEGVGYLRVS